VLSHEVALAAAYGKWEGEAKERNGERMAIKKAKKSRADFN
jgi:hypothetical protein